MNPVSSITAYFSLTPSLPIFLSYIYTPIHIHFTSLSYPILSQSNPIQSRIVQYSPI
ncbi:hypothetical protein BofuT4_uP156130.1 [Botrytis cinerea T4]|uniref:Uncharacterized protein n=1 Tax=Botryotinia fuckeliana (strain T4) TaxID=999810 RepID=G2YUB9_BOTF4|nr:hypothetical protein BofuT4_uP156130.1 [Botrytis cinerea T4]